MREIVKTHRVLPLADELLVGLRDTGPRRERAVGELYVLLLGAARYEIRRRAATLRHVGSDELEDLATQAADDACVAVIDKLHQFRGESRFSTWAYKFALNEASVRARLRAWQDRETAWPPEHLDRLTDDTIGPVKHSAEMELLHAITALIDTRLSQRQRDVLVSLAVQGTPIDVLADRLGTSRGALYKSLHDARRTLRRELANADFDLVGLAGD